MAYTNWLVNATNLEELKTLYYNLARQHHPDMGGDTEIMQQINAEYSLRVKLFKAGFNVASPQTGRSRQERRSRPPRDTSTEWGRLDLNKDAWDAYKSVCEMRESERYPFGISVKIVGGKVLVGGKATYHYRERLKRLGFMWNSSTRYWTYVRKPLTS